MSRSLGYAPPTGTKKRQRATNQASVRLDEDTRARLEDFMERSGFKFSQAVRTAVALGLRDTVSFEDEYLYAARKEGILAGARMISQRLQSAIADSLDEIEEEEA